MKITLLCVGRIKEKYFKSAVEEYSKRLSRYCRLTVLEVPDEPCPEKLSESMKQKVLDREGERILSKIPKDSRVITLEIKGKKMTSEQLSRFMQDLPHQGVSSLTFVIGGSLGLSPAVSAVSSHKLSFSDMTFPHQMMRMILLEQIYRGYRIMKNEPYHK